VYFPFDLLEELDALAWEDDAQPVDHTTQFVVATIQDRLEEMDRHAEESFEMMQGWTGLKRLRISIPNDMPSMEEAAFTPASAKKPRTAPPAICPLDEEEKTIDGVWLG
jgi:hypothetical protein